MSGLEVTGVVLGAIPLVISALEHYGEGVAIMKSMRNYEEVFNDVHIQFSASVVIYMESCHQLIGPLNLPDHQMNELLEKRSKDAWNDKTLGDAIMARLGSKYKVYLSLVETLNKRILLFCRKLKLNNDLRPIWISPDGVIDEKARKKFFKSAWRRISGGFDSAKYAALLLDIDRNIDKISKLTSGTVQLDPIRSERKSRIRPMHWQNVRDQAQRLFDTLSSRFYPCPCSLPHQANLRLDILRDLGEKEDANRFAFLLTFEKSAHNLKSLPWRWRDIEIESSQCPLVQAANPPTRSFSPKTVQFAPAMTVSPLLGHSSRSPPPSLVAKIENLCKTLVDNSRLGCCLGVLDDQPWQHHVYAVTGPGSKNQILESATLNEVIHGGKAIATRQKCTLALTLACSILQLHDTPWLPKSWDTNDIHVLRSHSGSTLPSAYVSRTFSPQAAINAAMQRRRCIKNEQVFALGVAMLELAYREPLLSFKRPEDLSEFGKEDSMTEVSIATRLADQIHELESENYARAVLRCIRCSFDTFSIDFENEEFRQKFFEGVVMPLQADWEFATRGKSSG